MPAFSAIGAYVAGTLLGLTGATVVAGVGLSAAGVFVASVVAVGIGTITSRLINGSNSGTSSGNEAGTRQTIAPATTNKIPVIYGSVFQQGIITDARISNENKTMTYVLTLSEKTRTGGTFTVGDIFWGDSKLNFRSGSEAHIVASSTDPNGDNNTKLNGLVRVWVYAGGTESSYQIFGPSTPVNARTALGESDTNYKLRDLVFAVVQIDYSPDNGVTGLPAVTFQINNSLKNPGLVWYDYMTADYGANLDSAYVDTVSSISTATGSLYSYSLDQTGLIQYESNGTTPLNQARYEINGIIPTGNTVKRNLEKINTASASFTTYDIASGKWKVIPNRPATTAELASAFVFNDNNILSEVSITTTPFEDQYNQLEVEFPSRAQRDQTDYFKDELDPAQRNDLEPDNALRLSVEMVNNSVHAGRIGRIELRQSRVDLVISFTADYSAIQCQAGDVVKVTNSVYGLDNDLFRITRVREIEGDDGSLVAEIIALEYNEEVYEEATLSLFANKPVSDIPLFGSTSAMKTPGAPSIENITPIGSIPYFDIKVTIPDNSMPVDTVDIFYSNTLGGNYVFYESKKSPNQVYLSGDEIYWRISGVPAASYFIKARVGSRNQYSTLSTASSELVWNPAPTAVVTGTNFASYFQPATLSIPRTYAGTATFTGVITKLYGQTAGEQVDFVNVSNDSSMGPNQWRIGATASTGYSDIVLNNITINKEPVDGTTWAQWSAPTAMADEPATMSVPVRFKNSLGDVFQAPNAEIQYTFQSQGPQGNPGSATTGTTGPRTATGFIYYNISQETAPSSPTASGFDFTTGTFTTLTTNWSTTYTADASAQSKYWAVSYTVSESTFGGSQTVTLTSVFNWIKFNGLVTFSNLATNTGTTFIDGGNIKTKTIVADAITATQLSSISANLGSVTAGSLSIGSTPAVSGTTMTGSGAKINTDGTFALGNTTTNISFNNTQMTLNGNVVATGNINLNATSSLIGALPNTQPLSVTAYDTNYILSYLATTSTGMASTWIANLYANITPGFSYDSGGGLVPDRLLYFQQKVEAGGVTETNYFSPRDWFYMTNIAPGGVTVNWGVRVQQNGYGVGGMATPFGLDDWIMIVSQFKR